MTDTLIAPELDPFPDRRRWTREECARLEEVGFLTGRYELIDGEILPKMPQDPPHATAIVLVLQWILTLFSPAQVRGQLPVAIPGAASINDPLPDVAVTTEVATAYAARHPGPADLLLLVEVASTTLRFDLTTKALLYARAGVGEYWVVDVAGRQLHVHRAPSASGYGDVVVFAAHEEAATLARPDAPVRVADLLA